MQIQNHASFPVIADCTFLNLGSGDDTLIFPGHSAEVLGPLIGDIEARPFYAVLSGTVVCHDDPNKDFFRVEQGNPAYVRHTKGILTIRHYLDKENCTPAANDPDQK